MINVQDMSNRPLPKDSTNNGKLLTGFTGRRNLWTFAFEKQTSIWALEDLSRHRNATREEQVAFSSLTGVREAERELWSRPIFLRSNVATALVHWQWDFGKLTYVEQAATKMVFAEALYSMTGRYEGDATKVWTVYTASRTKIYKLLPYSKSTTLMASAPAGTLFRGVVLPPYPATSPTMTATRSRSATATRSRSRAKPRGRVLIRGTQQEVEREQEEGQVWEGEQ